MILTEEDLHRFKRAEAEQRLVKELEKVDPKDAMIIVMSAAVRAARRLGVTRDGFVRTAGDWWDAVGE